MKKIILIFLLSIFAFTAHAQKRPSVYFHTTGQVYKVNDLVSLDGVIYRKVSATISAEIPPTASWKKLTDVEVATITASNGLTLNAGDIKIGGSLVEETIIQNVGNDFFLGDVSTGGEGGTLINSGFELKSGNIDIKNSSGSNLRLNDNSVLISNSLNASFGIGGIGFNNEGANVNSNTRVTFSSATNEYRFRSAPNEIYGIFDFSLLGGLSPDRTFLFQDKDGTIAHLDDINSIYSADGTIAEERTVTLDPDASLSINTDSGGIFIGNGGLIGSELNVTLDQILLNTGQNSINTSSGSSLEIIGADGLQIRPGTGGLVVNPTAGQFLRAIDVNGFVEWADVPNTTASNGLNKNGDDIKLGLNPLTEDTYFDPAGNVYHIGSWSDEEGSVQYGNGFTMLGNDVDYSWINSDNSFIRMQNGSFDIGRYSNGGGATINFIGVQNDSDLILNASDEINFTLSYQGANSGYKFRSNQNGAFGELNFRPITADRIISFQDKDYTIAGLDDISTAANGLTKSGSDIKLGGLLTEETIVESNGNDIYVGETESSLELTLVKGLFIEGLSNNVSLEGGDNNSLVLGSSGDTDLQALTGDLRIQSQGLLRLSSNNNEVILKKGTNTNQVTFDYNNVNSQIEILIDEKDGTLALKEDGLLNSYTVATLPASPEIGSLAYVTDATTPTYRGVVAGGGSEIVLVFYNGTNWISH